MQYECVGYLEAIMDKFKGNPIPAIVKYLFTFY